MKKLSILFSINLLLTISVIGQIYNPTLNNCDEIITIEGSPKPSLQDMSAGVWAAVITNSPEKRFEIPIYNALYKYLNALGFKVRYMSDSYFSPDQLGEDLWVSVELSYDVKKFTNVKLKFFNSGTGYTWMFSTNKIVKRGSYDNVEGDFYNVFVEMYSYIKPPFDKNKTIQLPKKLTCWNEYSIKQDFQTNGVDQIEGIYENTSHSNYYEENVKVALKKINTKYHLIYLSGVPYNSGDWQEGEIKATLQPTATPNLFKANWIAVNKTEDDDYYVAFEQGLMSVVDNSNQTNPYLKLYPTAVDNVSSISNTPATGTGFAISSNGLIVTNNHVIEGAKTIKVRGVNGDFSRAYSAKLIITDKNNDLAIIMIDDYSFKKLETIPYIIKSSGNVGENIFVLGYPLRTTMGDEIKLTNGVISSKTGFKGDVTSYQISAPIQQGNSGGPLFDSQGNLIGVINAKHIGAENASYAIKSSYLENLIDLLDSSPTLQNRSNLSGKSLSQQVSIVKNFVYTIEVN